MNKNKYNFAMIATYLRIILSPVIGYFILQNTSQSYLIAFCIFIPTALTDWLDGYLSRKLNEESKLGQLMDPIADKVLIQICIFTLSYNQVISPAILIILLMRNSFISGLRSIAAFNKIIITSRPLGKLKTALQMISIPMLLVYQYLQTSPSISYPSNLLHLANTIFGQDLFFFIAYSLLWVASFLSVLSGIEYSWQYFSRKK